MIHNCGVPVGRRWRGGCCGRGWSSERSPAPAGSTAPNQRTTEIVSCNGIGADFGFTPSCIINVCPNPTTHKPLLYQILKKNAFVCTSELEGRGDTEHS